MILALAGGHKVGAEQNILTAFSGTIYNWPGWFDVELKQLKLKNLDLLNQGTQLLFYWLPRQLWRRHTLGRLWSDFAQTMCGDRWYCLLLFDSNQSRLDLIWLSLRWDQKKKKKKKKFWAPSSVFPPKILKKFGWNMVCRQCLLVQWTL